MSDNATTPENQDDRHVGLLRLYHEMGGPLAAEAKAAAERIRQHGEKQNAAIIAIGKELTAIKAKLGHGHFGRWIDAEFKMSADTAQRYVRVAKEFGGLSNAEPARYLPLAILDLLAAKSTPKVVRDGVLTDVKAGRPPTRARVRSLITKAKRSVIDKPQRKTAGNPLTLAPRIEAAKVAYLEAERLGDDPKTAAATAVAEIDTRLFTVVIALNDFNAAAVNVIDRLGRRRAVALANAIISAADIGAAADTMH
jgi:hypothetical protein